TTASHNSAGSAGAARAPLAQPGAANPLPSGFAIVYSGQNYDADTLRMAGTATLGTLSSAPAEPVPGPSAKAPPQRADGGTDSAGDVGPLSRLTERESLGQCLATIVARYGGQPVVVEYAGFNGAPALIVVLAEHPTGRRIVVAGPNCGLPGSGPDERYSV